MRMDYGSHREPQRKLSAGECRAVLASHHEGRLGYQSGRGPRSVVVSYAITEDAIMMRLPDYNDAVHYAPGAEVRLEVDGLVPAGMDEVLVTGTAVVDDERGRSHQSRHRPPSRRGGRRSVRPARVPGPRIGCRGRADVPGSAGGRRRRAVAA